MTIEQEQLRCVQVVKLDLKHYGLNDARGLMLVADRHQQPLHASIHQSQITFGEIGPSRAISWH